MSSTSEFGSPNTGGQFPSTRHSALIALRGDDTVLRERALEKIARVYWPPIYTYIRLRWKRDPDEACDLTQSFFLQVLEKDFFASYDRERARFRTFLRVCLDRFIQREDSAASRQKRGGGATSAPIDVGELEETLRSSNDSSPDVVFEREWARALFSLATENLKSRCESTGRARAFRIFERYDLEVSVDGNPVTYALLAAETGTTVDDVTNQLAYARREFRSVVLELLREMTASEDEFRDEARSLLGINI